jgi:hypothetical protein
MSIIRLIASIWAVGTIVASLGQAANAGPFKWLKPLRFASAGPATGYSSGGDYGPIIGPRAKFLNPGVISSLNPQPLPPRSAVLGQRTTFVNPGVLSTLSPSRPAQPSVV